MSLVCGVRYFCHKICKIIFCPVFVLHVLFFTVFVLYANTSIFFLFLLCSLIYIHIYSVFNVLMIKNLMMFLFLYFFVLLPHFLVFPSVTVCYSYCATFSFSASLSFVILSLVFHSSNSLPVLILFSDLSISF